MNKKYKVLDEIYKNLPKIECKGFCHNSCSNIPASRIEIKRAKVRLKTNPYFNLKELIEKNNMTCRALKEGRCTIHAIRPAICRFYGVAEGLACEFVCKPKEYLPDGLAHQMIRIIEKL